MSTEVTVSKLPDCDIHRYNLGQAGVEAHYDAKTAFGPWANMCESCFVEVGPGRLGTGYGQRLVVKEAGK